MFHEVAAGTEGLRPGIQGCPVVQQELHDVIEPYGASEVEERRGERFGYMVVVGNNASPPVPVVIVLPVVIKVAEATQNAGVDQDGVVGTVLGKETLRLVAGVPQRRVEDIEAVFLDAVLKSKSGAHPEKARRDEGVASSIDQREANKVGAVLGHVFDAGGGGRLSLTNMSCVAVAPQSRTR